MKLNKYFLIGAMGLGLFACSDNDLADKGQDNGNKVEEGTTYVAFSLDFKNLNSRATEEGKTKEQTITTAYVILADANGNFTKVISNSNVVDVENNETGAGYYKTGEKYLFKTTAGDHIFYAVVNPDAVPTTDDNAKTYFDTEQAIAVAAITADNEFMMSSVKEENFYVKDGVTEEEALAGTSNSFSIAVERVSAKVTVTCVDPILKGTVIANSDDTESDEGDSDETTETTTTAGGKIVPSSTKFTLAGIANMTYRMKQNSIEEISTATYIGKSEATAVCFKQESDEVNNLHNLAAAAYCLENLHNDYYQENTTYITLETAFIPSVVVNCDATDEAATKTITITDDTEAASFYVVLSGKLAGNYLLADELSTFQAKEGNTGKYPLGVESISEIYTDGVCYFGPIWIGQDVIGESAAAPVNRNYWYNFTISGITLPGQPNPVEPKGGKTPLEPETNVAITLSVEPWNFVSKDLYLQ